MKYFLASNSSEGFVSYFGECYDPFDGWRTYIIKGGPGTGKSSFMKYLAVKAAEHGVKTELFPCSSDPNSLDAVIFPCMKLAVMDGTSPHTVEPKYPAVCESLLNFGDFWDNTEINKNKGDIIRLTLKNRALHKTASRYIKAAGIIASDSLKTAAACTDFDKAEAFALSLCGKYIPKKQSLVGREWNRFLSGITPLGTVSYADSVSQTLERCIIINDRIGSVSNTVMNRIRSYALDNGYEIITVKNFLLPSLLCDCIIIPSLSLGFMREYTYGHLSSHERRIHARRFISAESIGKSRERLRFNKKAVRELLLCASDTLSRAKAVHDELEACYVSAMDFEALTEFAQNTADRLFGF